MNDDRDPVERFGCLLALAVSLACWAVLLWLIGQAARRGLPA